MCKGDISFFCLIVRENVVGEPFRLKKTLDFEKIRSIKGGFMISILIGKFSFKAKNFVGGTL